MDHSVLGIWPLRVGCTRMVWKVTHGRGSGLTVMRAGRPDGALQTSMLSLKRHGCPIVCPCCSRVYNRRWFCFLAPIVASLRPTPTVRFVWFDAKSLFYFGPINHQPHFRDIVITHLKGFSCLGLVTKRRSVSPFEKLIFNCGWFWQMRNIVHNC